MRLRRRHVVAGGLAAAVAFALRPDRLASPPPPTGSGASRHSRLLPGLWLAYADLHNHSHLSDGTGEAGHFHAAMRAAGLDIAALTDHTVAAPGRRDPCTPSCGDLHHHNPCRSRFGIGTAGWHWTRRLADEADTPLAYAALSGFEWSSPHLGHMNIWFSEDWVDPLATGAITAPGLARVGRPVDLMEAELRAAAADGGSQVEVAALVDAIRAQAPAGMRLLYDWLAHPPGEGPAGGGADALAGFNHPNREPGIFDHWAYDPRVADRVVTLEIFNRDQDYLFKNVTGGLPSPLVGCLNAGWRVGLIGASDEHGGRWGTRPGTGRAGIWLDRLDRRAVQQALRARRVFATRETGAKLAATAAGEPMGRPLPRRRGAVEFAVDVDLGPERAGMPIAIQVLRPDTRSPRVVDVIAARAGGPGGAPAVRFRVPLDPGDGDWVVLRIADPARPNDTPAPFAHPCNNFALAYSSPWWLTTGGASTVGPPAIMT